MFIGLHVKYPLFLLILMKLEFSWQIFHKFHENPSFRSQVVPWRLKGGQTDMTKLIVPFHNSANAPKKESVSFSVAKHRRNRITKRERRWKTNSFGLENHLPLFALFIQKFVFCFKYMNQFLVIMHFCHCKACSCLWLGLRFLNKIPILNFITCTPLHT